MSKICKIPIGLSTISTDSKDGVGNKKGSEPMRALVFRNFLSKDID